MTLGALAPLSLETLTFEVAALAESVAEVGQSRVGPKSVE